MKEPRSRRWPLVRIVQRSDQRVARCLRSFMKFQNLCRGPATASTSQSRFILKTKVVVWTLLLVRLIWQSYEYRAISYIKIKKLFKIRFPVKESVVQNMMQRLQEASPRRSKCSAPANSKNQPGIVRASPAVLLCGKKKIRSELAHSIVPSESMLY